MGKQRHPGDHIFGKPPVSMAMCFSSGHSTASAKVPIRAVPCSQHEGEAPVSGSCGGCPLASQKGTVHWKQFWTVEADDFTGSFKIQQWDMVRHDFLESAPGLGLFVTVTTYSEEVLLSKLYGPQGTFHFTSHSPGEHIICLESNSTRLVSFGGSKLRIHLDIHIGEHDLHAAIAQAKDKVNEVSFKLEHLIEQIEQIVKEQNYQRDREENFRMTSEDTNSNVLWWAFTQTLIFISVGIFQMKYLRDFFIAKKLV